MSDDRGSLAHSPPHWQLVSMLPFAVLYIYINILDSPFLLLPSPKFQSFLIQLKLIIKIFFVSFNFPTQISYSSFLIFLPCFYCLLYVEFFLRVWLCLRAACLKISSPNRILSCLSKISFPLTNYFCLSHNQLCFFFHCLINQQLQCLALWFHFVYFLFEEFTHLTPLFLPFQKLTYASQLEFAGSG